MLKLKSFAKQTGATLIETCVAFAVVTGFASYVAFSPFLPALTSDEDLENQQAISYTTNTHAAGIRYNSAAPYGSLGVRTAVDWSLMSLEQNRLRDDLDKLGLDLPPGATSTCIQAGWYQANLPNCDPSTFTRKAALQDTTCSAGGYNLTCDTLAAQLLANTPTCSAVAWCVFFTGPVSPANGPKVFLGSYPGGSL